MKSNGSFLMCDRGCLTIPGLRENAKMTLISYASIVEDDTQDVVVKDSI